MIKRTILTAGLMCLFGLTPGFGKTVTDEKSGVSVDLPEGQGWTLEEGKNTTAVNDEGVSLVIIRIDKELPDVVIKRLADAMSPLMNDAKASDDAEKVVVHGMQADKLSGYGRKDDKAVKFTALLICKDNTSTLAIVAIGSETPFKRHLREIDETFDSVRPK